MSFLLEARNLVRTYQGGGIFRKTDPVKAVDGVSLRIQPGETLGIVGESGCGKSTLGRMLLGIDDATEGEVLLDGKPLPKRNTLEWRKLRAQMQLVFQDPLAALDRRLTIAAQIGEPLQIHGIARGTELKDRVDELMISVGLRRDQEIAIRMNYLAVSASVSSLPARLRQARACWSATSRFRHSMFPFRRRSSICCVICRNGMALPWFSSAMISRSCAISATEWRSCISARLSKKQAPVSFLKHHSIPIQKRLFPPCLFRESGLSTA